MAPGSMTLADLKGRGRGGRGRGGGGGRAGRGQPFGRGGGRGGGGRRGKRAREEDDVAGANRAFQGGGRQLVSPPEANPWTHASGRVQPPPSRREVDRDAVRESWREKQVDLEDVSALAAFEEKRRREEEEKARAAAEEEARAAKAARIAARAAARAAASKQEPPSGDVIDLISDDEGDDDDDVRGKGRATSLSTGGKENREAPREAPREPTRAELAAEAAKRRAAYNEHMARSATASAIGSRGGRLGGASGDAPGYDHRGGGGGGNPLLDPPRYMPDPASASAEDLRLSTDEIAEVRDVGMSWYPCNACLDTGNGGCTLIVRSLAVRMGLCDAFGNPTGGGFARFVEVRGVVEGASERVPMTTLVYRIKGKEMCVQAGITGAALGCDLLISRREIAEFERDGYTLTAR